MSRSTQKSSGLKSVFEVGGTVNGKPATPVLIPRPRPDYPLSPTVTGWWQKKIGGRIFRFGKWTDGRRDADGRFVPLPDYGATAAETEYRRKVGDAMNGKAPDEPGAAVATVGSLCSWFLRDALLRLGLSDAEVDAVAKAEAEAVKNANGADEKRIAWRKPWWEAVKGKRGETISARQVMEYRETTLRLARTFGKARPVAALTADDFTKLRADLAKQFGTVRLGNEVAKVKAVFNRAAKFGIIERLPVFGGFVKPSKKARDLERDERGERFFTPDECRKLIAAADPTMRAMILLALNAGFGPTDLGELPRSAVDLVNGWVSYRRSKTGQARLAKLWPESVQALTDAYAARPVPDTPEHTGLVFLTRFGNPFASDGFNTLTSRFAKLLEATGLNDRPGRGFYSLRHVHRSHSENAGDLSAARFVMGHANGHVEAGYIHRTPEATARIAKVCQYVRARVLGTEGGTS
jgi:integrase